MCAQSFVPTPAAPLTLPLYLSDSSFLTRWTGASTRCALIHTATTLAVRLCCMLCRKALTNALILCKGSPQVVVAFWVMLLLSIIINDVCCGVCAYAASRGVCCGFRVFVPGVLYESVLKLHPFRRVAGCI